MADTPIWFEPRKPDLDPAPRDIIREREYRGQRIIQTRDTRFVGDKDAWGFSLDVGFIVRDEFDDYVLPVPMHAFYSPHDAIDAIEMRDTILPTIKADQPATTLVYEYQLMWSYRVNFSHTYGALKQIEKACLDARDFDENPREKVLDILNLLRAAVARGPLSR